MKGVSTMSDAPKKDGPELFIGLVGPIGTDLDTVSTLFEAGLRSVADYKTSMVNLIDLIKELEPWKDLSRTPVADYYDKAMTAGNTFRQEIGRGDALAIMAMRYIREGIRRKEDAPNAPVPRRAYILRSLKHPHEVASLRRTYGDSFFLIGAYSPRSERSHNLAKKIAAADLVTPSPEHKLAAEKLIDRDEDEPGVTFGQAVSETFPLADFFLDASKPREEVRRAITRIIELIFGHPFHTPTRQELGMFHAHAAALRSASMGRQVGALIQNTSGAVIATGTNEVPKAFGGQYWGDEPEDRRDHQIGFDSNDEIKRQNLIELLRRFRKKGFLSEQCMTSDDDEMLESAITALKGIRLMSPIEYGRAVHAEMSALIDASKRGVSVDKAILYSTTFPCHECARHIVAAGIRTVYYIEPYPKSLAGNLHSDSISIEEPETVSKVRFLPFVGVAPSIFTKMFSMPLRKDKQGKVVSWDGRTSSPRFPGPSSSYFEVEDHLGAILNEKMRETQLSLIN